MSACPFLMESEIGTSCYTHLHACISEEDEDGSFIVQLKLYNSVTPDSAAWGEETADCFEVASMMIASLAKEFDIPADRIDIELRMNNFLENTRH